MFLPYSFNFGNLRLPRVKRQIFGLKERYVMKFKKTMTFHRYSIERTSTTLVLYSLDTTTFS